MGSNRTSTSPTPRPGGAPICSTPCMSSGCRWSRATSPSAMRRLTALGPGQRHRGPHVPGHPAPRMMLARPPEGPGQPDATAEAKFQLPYRASFLLPQVRWAELPRTHRGGVTRLPLGRAGADPGGEVLARLRDSLSRGNPTTSPVYSMIYPKPAVYFAEGPQIGAEDFSISRVLTERQAPVVAI
jgi:hypothetical protein